jgi:hypothetical protein
MGYVHDHGTCQEHGFALSPEGSCVRCRNEAAHAARRARIAKLVAGGAFAVTLLGFGAAYGRMQTPEPPPPVVALAPVVATPPATRSDELPRSPVTSPETHVLLDKWEAEMARADAQRAAELAAKAQAEKGRMRAALNAPVGDTTIETGHGRVDNSSESLDHPSWWQDPGYRRPGRGSIAAQQRAMAAAGVAPYNVTSPSAWLPSNNGGNFTTRH